MLSLQPALIFSQRFRDNSNLSPWARQARIGAIFPPTCLLWRRADSSFSGCQRRECVEEIYTLYPSLNKY